VNKYDLASLRQKVFGTRLWIGLSIVLVAAFLVRPSPKWGRSKLAGLFLVLGGIGLRAWGAAAAGGHTRTSRIEGTRLATHGPFAYTRNPIYLGSMILGLGMVFLIGDPFMLLPSSATFLFLYFLIIPAEEEFLRKTFGRSYQTYRENVPRLAPRMTAWSGAEPAPLDYRSAAGEWRIAAICVGILIFFWGVVAIRESQI
jgi:protein-S-isoprenylcysteine O-methyltransferase Ste14